MSKMTSRELVRRTLEFNSPERIPVICGSYLGQKNTILSS